MFRLPLLTACATLAFAAHALALDLDAAKAQGLVGETREGYLAAVSPAPEAAALAADINRKRRAEYQRISAGNGQPLNVVEKLAAQKLYERLQPGQYYQDGGSWKRK